MRQLPRSVFRDNWTDAFIQSSGHLSLWPPCHPLVRSLNPGAFWGSRYWPTQSLTVSSSQCQRRTYGPGQASHSLHPSDPADHSQCRQMAQISPQRPDRGLLCARLRKREWAAGGRRAGPCEHWELILKSAKVMALTLIARHRVGCQPRFQWDGARDSARQAGGPSAEGTCSAQSSRAERCLSSEKGPRQGPVHCDETNRVLPGIHRAR